ncbi:hypothetical protein [Robertmurraya sp.]|uniref:hypothetical protein n=1 Tax=Robertmurraya sp. TaxID=2837525 RepID=UPI00370433D6
MRNLKLVYESLTPLTASGTYQQIMVRINGEEKIYHVVSERVVMSSMDTGWWGSSYPIYIYELMEFQQVKMPTKEELAAEESVAKAKEALKAAENALKVVKEKK